MQYKVIYICSAKPQLNKKVLRRRLKDAVVDWWSLMSVGRLFQTRTTATANALSPNLLRVRGRNRLPLSADRDEACDGRSATGLMRSAMYCGACPTSALWTSRHSLKSILSAIGSQCSSSNDGVTWSHGRRLRTIRAAAWRTRCNGLSVVCGSGKCGTVKDAGVEITGVEMQEEIVGVENATVENEGVAIYGKPVLNIFIFLLKLVSGRCVYWALQTQTNDRSTCSQYSELRLSLLLLPVSDIILAFGDVKSMLPSVQSSWKPAMKQLLRYVSGANGCTSPLSVPRGFLCGTIQLWNEKLCREFPSDFLRSV